MEKKVKKRPGDEMIPLKTGEFYILLALADGQLHGYGMMERSREDSAGTYELAPGLLYATLERLTAGGLIELAGERPGERSAHRQQLYRLTEAGRTVLRRELARWRRGLRLARERLRQR